MRKKLLALIMALLVFIPFLVNAASLEDYNATTVQEALNDEEISYNVADFKTNDKQITIYLFRGKGCGHCYEFLEYIANTLVKTHGDKFTVKVFETWYDEKNSELMNIVGSYMGDTSLGVPYFIIGDQSFIGYAESMNSDIVAKIESEYNSKERVDKVVEALEASGNEDSGSVSSSSIIWWNFAFTVIAVIVIIVYFNIKFGDLEQMLTSKKK